MEIIFGKRSRNIAEIKVSSFRVIRYLMLGSPLVGRASSPQEFGRASSSSFTSCVIISVRRTSSTKKAGKSVMCVASTRPLIAPVS